MPRTGNRAAIYTRVSTEKQAEKHSLPAQRRIMAEVAKKRGLVVTEVYEDAGISGETIAARPAFQKLLADAGDAKFDFLLTIDTDRLSRSRDLRTWAEILDTLRGGGIRIVTPHQELDPEDEEDVFLTHLFGILAAREKAKIARRARRGTEQAVRDGQRIGGKAPYGYTYDKNTKKLVIEPREAEIVRTIYDLYEQGLSQYQIGAALEERGMHPRNGAKKWWRTMIRTILTVPACTGYAVWHRTTTESGKFEIRDRSEWVWSDEPSHEAIIDLARWERVQTLRKRRGGTKKAPSKPSSSYFLSGLLKCSCGTRMNGRTYKQKRVSGKVAHYRYYQCAGPEKGKEHHPSIRADEAEEQVVAEIAALAESPEFLERARKQILLDRMRSNTRAGEDLDAMRTELAEVQRKQGVLYEDRLEGRIATAQWERFHADLVEREEKLAGEIDAAERAILAGAGGATDIGEMLEVLRAFRKVFGGLDPREKKQVLGGMVAEVRAAKRANEDIRVILRSPWDSLGVNAPPLARRLAK